MQINRGLLDHQFTHHCLSLPLLLERAFLQKTPAGSGVQGLPVIGLQSQGKAERLCGYLVVHSVALVGSYVVRRVSMRLFVDSGIPRGSMSSIVPSEWNAIMAWMGCVVQRANQLQA